MCPSGPPGSKSFGDKTPPCRAGKGQSQWRKLGRGNRKDNKRSADEKRWGIRKAELEERILRLRKEGVGLVKIGRTLGVGTSVVQRVLASG